MNILPLVFTFLLIFACLSVTFFKDLKSFYLAETTLTSYQRTERALNNAIAQKAYRKIPVEKKEKKEQPPKKKIEYKSKRTMSPPLEKSKFNIGPLVKHQSDIKMHPLYEILAEYFRILYSKSVFCKEAHSEKIEYRLIDAMIREAKKASFASTDLSQLYPEDAELKKIFYTLLQGTNQYDRAKGIPPLRDVLTIQKDSPAISLSFAAPSLLEALFGIEIAGEIIETERLNWAQTGKYYFYSKKDLQSLPSRECFGVICLE